MSSRRFVLFPVLALAAPAANAQTSNPPGGRVRTANAMIGLPCIAAVLLLAGCNPSHESSSESGASPVTAEPAAPGAPAWNAADACTLLDKATVAKAMGDAVTETRLAFVHQAAGQEAATSECTYALQGGGDVVLMARRSPIADNTDQAIAQTRKAAAASVAAFTDKPVEDVLGLGKAAFFVPGINQMNVFLDDEKFVVLTVGGAPAATAKSLATDLVRAIEP